jgi:hypothetical protein
MFSLLLSVLVKAYSFQLVNRECSSLDREGTRVLCIVLACNLKCLNKYRYVSVVPL